MYNFYDQVNGVSMGSPLGPVFANLFMGYHENKWLQEFNKGKVLMYKHYIHDIFCMFGNERDAENFLNSLTVNIKFTIENFCHFLIFLSKMKETLF